MAESKGLMTGKRGLVMGGANNRSMAWGIAAPPNCRSASNNGWRWPAPSRGVRNSSSSTNRLPAST